MRDLYHRIGLMSPTEDSAEIDRAIKSTHDAATARAARYILLDPNRKAVYDRTRGTLVQIGTLRANLGLSQALNWQACDCSDFQRAPSAGRQLGRLRRQPEPSVGGSRVWGVPLLVVAALLLGSGVIFGILQPSSSSPRSAYQSPPRSPSATPPRYTNPRTSAPLRGTTDLLDELEIRKHVSHRFERAGVWPDQDAINAAVQKVLAGQADPLPRTGVLSKSFVGTGVAPLEIKTRGGGHYYIKVVDWATKEKQVLTAFIRGGEPFETEVPLGSYEIRYAAGQAWYGPLLDFGPGATYMRCDSRFDFTRDTGGYNGYTIELILQRHGNLSTDPITADQF